MFTNDSPVLSAILNTLFARSMPDNSAYHMVPTPLQLTRFEVNLAITSGLTPLAVLIPLQILAPTDEMPQPPSPDGLNRLSTES